MFVIGVVWFALASALCGAAQNGEMLITARALQGVGGALLTPGSLALVQSTFRQQDRAKAVGAWSGLGGVAGAVGPFLGGWLVDGPGWRWIFLLNVPVAAAVVAIAVRHVPESRDRTASGSFDVRGAALAALCLAGITYALIAASSSPSVLVVVVPAVVGVACGVAFVRTEQRREHPMLPLTVFSSRLFTTMNLVTLCLYAAIGGAFFLLPVQLQIAAGYSALRAGLATLPVTVLMLLLSAPAGGLAQRIGPRWLLTLGPLLTAVGLLLLTRIGPGSSSYLAGRAARGGGAGAGDEPVRGAADRDRAGLGGGGPRRGGQRGEQRGRPGGPTAGGGRAAAGGGPVRPGVHLAARRWTSRSAGR